MSKNLSALLVSILTAGAAVTPRCCEQPASGRPVQQTAAQSDSDGDLTRTFKKNGYKFEIVTPRITQKDSAQAQKLTAVINEFIDDEISEFLEVQKDQSNKDKHTEFGYEAGIERLTPDLLSVSITVSQSEEGAAHPKAWPVTLNYDIKHNSMITMSQILDPNSDCLQYLSSECRKRLTEDMPEIYVKPDKANSEYLTQWKQMLNHGTEAAAKNFKAIVFTDEGIEIKFGEYAVGPYSIGMPTVDFTYEELKPYLTKYAANLH